MPRLEIRLTDFEAERLDELRGTVPKGTWVKRQLGLGVAAPVPEPAFRPPTERPPLAERLARAQEVSGVSPATERLREDLKRNWRR